MIHIRENIAAVQTHGSRNEIRDVWSNSGNIRKYETSSDISILCSNPKGL